MCESLDVVKEKEKIGIEGDLLFTRPYLTPRTSRHEWDDTKVGSWRANWAPVTDFQGLTPQ